MSAFPILLSLEVHGYGMYPGADRKHELLVKFQPGLTLVLGANGLGKSTLVGILFRMLTGPFDLQLPAGSIGTSELKAVSLNRHNRMAYGARVSDGAANSTATLKFALGDRQFSVKRSLADLSLLSLQCDAKDLPDEAAFQNAIIKEARLATFGEWILVLRTIVFFFEERRTLIWDPSAQRQLLRCLLLPPEQASAWATAEREILELDTRMRNLQAALRREQREVSEIERRVEALPGVTAALNAAEIAFKNSAERQEALGERIEVADQSRHRDRLDALRAGANYDSAIQEIERARLASIESRFPKADASIRYILARLMSDGECLVCQTSGQEAKRKKLIAAVDSRHCVVCNSPLPVEPGAPVDLSDERIEALRLRVEATKKSKIASQTALEASTKEYNDASKELAECSLELSSLRDKINALVLQLPPEERKARQQHDELKVLQGRVDSLRVMLKEKREEFTREMVKHREAILRFATAIKSAFESAASGFLFEESSLSWSPVRVQIGQAGAEGVEPTEYPAFSVELGGADFSDVVRRDGPDQVSESQREFIDLAFRMALIHVAAANQAGTIVIDAPESSLDAVFVERAADVLARFANANRVNRLIATSNLAAGELIPELLKAADSRPSRRASRIVDLFKEGVPTRAMEQLSAEYERHRKRLYRAIEK